MKVGWTSASLGASGTNLTVLGASAALNLEGTNVLTNNVHSGNNTKAGIGTTLTNILTINNRVTYNGRFNLGKVKPTRVSVDNDHNKGIVVEIYKNATLGGTTNYQYHNQTDSIVIQDTAGTTLSGDDLIDSFTVFPQGSKEVDLTVLNTELLPEQTYKIAARTVSGTSTNITAAITWKEEK